MQDTTLIRRDSVSVASRSLCHGVFRGCYNLVVRLEDDKGELIVTLCCQDDDKERKGMGYIMLVLYALFVAQDLLRYEVLLCFVTFKSRVATDIIRSFVSIYEAIMLESLLSDRFALTTLHFANSLERTFQPCMNNMLDTMMKRIMLAAHSLQQKANINTKSHADTIVTQTLGQSCP